MVVPVVDVDSVAECPRGCRVVPVVDVDSVAECRVADRDLAVDSCWVAPPVAARPGLFRARRLQVVWVVLPAERMLAGIRAECRELPAAVADSVVVVIRAEAVRI